MRTFSEVIDLLGGPTDFAKAVDTTDSHARTMKARGSIPPAYWPKLVDAAHERGVDGVTYRALAEIAARRGREKVSS